MFSCCFRVRGGSDLKNEKIRGHDGDHGGAWRHQVRSWLHCLWPFGEKEKTSSQGSQDQDRSDQVTTLKSPFSQISLLEFGSVKDQENVE